MYIDAVIIVALVIFALCWFRRFSKLVYAFAIIDIFLRLLHYVSKLLGIKAFIRWVNRYFPASIPSIIAKYSGGIIYTILIWVYVVIMAFFLFYTFRIFLKKKI